MQVKKDKPQLSSIMMRVHILSTRV